MKEKNGKEEEINEIGNRTSAGARIHIFLSKHTVIVFHPEECGNSGQT